MQVEITNVNRKERVSKKNGKTFTSIGIQTKEHGDKWLSGFGDKINCNWQVGDRVNIAVTANGEWLNFKADTSQPQTETVGAPVHSNEYDNDLSLRLTKIEQRLDVLEANIEGEIPF